MTLVDLLANELDVDNIRRETWRGREYLVAPVKPIRAMKLDKGYVPRAEVVKSAPAWNGTPITLNHPVNANGDFISANSPDVAEATWLGHLWNVEAIDGGEFQTGEAWYDIEHARNLGGEAEAIIDRLEAGEPVSVSSSYFGDQLPPGEYDGKFRDEVMGNLRPDHLATLPNMSGKCSIEDGCMVGAPAANCDECDCDDCDGSVTTEPSGASYRQVLDALNEGDGPFVVVEADAESATQTDDPDTADTGEDEDAEEMTTNTPPADADESALRAWLLSVFGIKSGEQSVNESAESDATQTTTNPTMGDKTNELVENFGLNAEALPDEDSDEFASLYEQLTSTNDDDSTDTPDVDDGTDTTADADDGTDTSADAAGVDAILSRLEQMESQMVTKDSLGEAVAETLTANQKRERKSDLADELIANSDDWSDEDRETLMETPLGVLERTVEQARDEQPALGANYAAMRGAASQPSDGDKANPMFAMTASELAANRDDEGDD